MFRKAAARDLFQSMFKIQSLAREQTLRILCLICLPIHLVEFLWLWTRRWKLKKRILLARR